MVFALAIGIWQNLPVKPSKAAVDGGVSGNIQMFDTNANGQIDRITFDIANPSVDTWGLVGAMPHGLSVAQHDGSVFQNVTILNVSFLSPTTAPSVTIAVDLDETDVNLIVNTDGVTPGWGQIELAYAASGFPVAVGIEDNDEELNAIAQGDTGLTDTEIDKAAPVIDLTGHPGSGNQGYWPSVSIPLNGDKVDVVSLYFTEPVVVTYNDADWLVTPNGLNDGIGTFDVTACVTVGAGYSWNGCPAGGSWGVDLIATGTTLTGVSGGTEPDIAYINNSNAIVDMSPAANIAASQSVTSLEDWAYPYEIGMAYVDNNGDGTIDGAGIQFSENVSYTYAGGDWTATANGLTGFNITGADSSCPGGVCTNVNPLPFAATANAWLTGVGGTTGVEPTLAYLAAVNFITDIPGGGVSSNSATVFGPVTMLDMASPVVDESSTTNYQYWNYNSTGGTDVVSLYFTEPVQLPTYTDSEWSITDNGLTGLDVTKCLLAADGYYDGCVLANSGWLDFLTAGTTNLTGVSGGTEPDIAYNGTGDLQDAAGNYIAAFDTSTFSTPGLLDFAQPYPLTIDYYSSLGDGTVDTFNIVFSEAVTYNGVSLVPQFAINNQSLTGFDSDTDPNAVSGSGTDTLTFTTSGTTNLTGVDSATGIEPDVSYAHNPGGLIPAGNWISDGVTNYANDFGPITMNDNASPVIIGGGFSDYTVTNSDAPGPQVLTAVFSEGIDTTTWPNVVVSTALGDFFTSSSFSWAGNLWSATTMTDDTLTSNFTINANAGEEYTATTISLSNGVSDVLDYQGNSFIPYNSTFPIGGAAQTLTVDTKAPTGTVTVVTDPLYEGDLIQEVTVTYDENMDPASTPTITFVGNTGALTSNVDGSWTAVNVWYETFTLTDADETSLGVTADSSGATDVVGNPEGADIGTTFDINTVAPTMTAVTADTDANGTVDQITITFSEAVDINDTGGIADGLDSITLGDGCTIPTDVDYTSSDVTSLVLSDLIDCTENDTSITPSVTYTTQLGCSQNFAICSNAPNEMADATTTNTVDDAAPVFLGAAYADVEPDGTVDGFIAFVSENVSYTYNAGDWTLVANDLTGFALTGCAACTNTNQLSFIAPAAANLTGVSGGTEPTITYTSGNLITEDAVAGHTVADFGPSSMVDIVSPRIIEAKYRSSGNNGTVDSIDVYFTETVYWNYGSLSQFDIINNDLTGLDDNTVPDSASGNGTNIITLTTSGTTNLTGIPSGLEPTLAYTHALFPNLGDRIHDGSSIFALADVTAFAMSDDAAPTVVSFSPTNGATGVATTAPVVITFSEPVDTSSLSYALPGATGTSYAWSVGDTVATISHDPFTSVTSYTVTVTSVKDISGNTIATTPSATFTTGSGSGSIVVVPTCQLVINSGAASTTTTGVSLAITSNQAVTEMVFSNDSGFTSAVWEPYAATKAWTLDSIGGNKIVYAIVKYNGVNSLVCSDSILYQVGGGGGGGGGGAGAPLPTTPTMPTTPGVLVLQDPAPAAEPLPLGVTVGTLVKRADMASVYFIDQDNRRHAFPNASAYLSYYPDFSGIQTVSAETLAAIPLGSNVVMRPGTYLVKIQSDPKVYAVEPYGVLRWISSEAIAQSLYGADWASKIVDVDVTFFINYQIGSDVVTNVHPAGSAFSYQGEVSVYYVDQAQKRYISSEVFINNKFQNKFIIRNISSAITYNDGVALPLLGMEQIMTLR